MTEAATLLQQEPVIRLGFFAGTLALMLLLESLFPRRKRRLPRLERWPGNFGIAMLNTFIVRLAFPVALVGFAAGLEAGGQGLLNQLELPAPITIALALIMLDLVIWAQHVLFHRFPVLWRFHSMHHMDLDIDATSGTRFHPIEILISVLIKFAAIRALGPPAVAVLWFEVILNAAATFNHANLKLPVALDHLLRIMIVTPDMHRIHHSMRPAETHSNFGFNLSIWDRLFGTYVAEPEAGHKDMDIGLPDFQDNEMVQRIDRMLAAPFGPHFRPGPESQDRNQDR